MDEKAMGQLVVNPVHMARMVAHSQQAYPFEGCGMLLGRAVNGRKVVVDVFPTGNAREVEARHNRYLIPPEEMLQGELDAEERGLDVIGYFHSHPDHPARPSEFDRDHAWPWYSYLILAVCEGQVQASAAWQLREDRSGFDEETIILLKSEEGQST
jgi:proteasome lid subunit RPN8/RPN11